MGFSKIALFSLFALFGLPTSLAKSSEEWRDRIIYQVITDRFAVDSDNTPDCSFDDSSYCGGTWSGIRSKLDYIQGMGFNAIWISPVEKNLEGSYGSDGEAYHGYWNTDFTQLNEHFGSEDDLIDLITDMHNRDMWIMFDALANSMAIPGPTDNISYSNLVPFNDSSYFHPYCWIDYGSNNNTDIEDCWTGDDNVILADLDIESTNVADYLHEHIHDMVERYQIDGIRIDAVKQMNPEFFPNYTSAAGVFAIGEMFSYDPNVSCSVRNYLDSITSYPIRQGIEFAFNYTGAAFEYLQEIDTQFQQACEGQDMSVIGNFLENHDLPRYTSITNDTSQDIGAIVFLLLHTGIPIIYYGEEQRLPGGSDTPENRAALWNYGYDTDANYYQTIRTAIALRKQAISDSDSWTTDSHSYLDYDLRHAVVRKGDVLGVYTNYESSSDNVTYDVSSNFDDGTVLREVLSNTTTTVGSSGALHVTVVSGLPQVYYPEASLTSFGNFLGTATSYSSASASYPSTSMSASLSSVHTSSATSSSKSSSSSSSSSRSGSSSSSSSRSGSTSSSGSSHTITSTSQSVHTSGSSTSTSSVAVTSTAYSSSSSSSSSSSIESSANAVRVSILGVAAFIAIVLFI